MDMLRGSINDCISAVPKIFLLAGSGVACTVAKNLWKFGNFNFFNSTYVQTILRQVGLRGLVGSTVVMALNSITPEGQDWKNRILRVALCAAKGGIISTFVSATATALMIAGLGVGIFFEIRDEFRVMRHRIKSLNAQLLKTQQDVIPKDRRADSTTASNAFSS
jgi:hypothetical protein